jgi:Zn-dependent protease/predicted transcriptional regulator
MFGRRITLFSIFGFEVRVDVSWIFLAVLVTWTLASGVFPHYYPDLPGTTYWSMAVVGAAGMFFSIIFHELSHSLVARRVGLPIGGITLFLFGGVAEMTDEPPSPRAEFLMAVAGPVASAVLGAAFFAVHLVASASGWPPAVDGVFFYLGTINFVLAGFNLVPAFPLDGGRMLRAILWHFKRDLGKATRTAAKIGGGFGILLVFLGLLNVVQGNFIGGMWWFLIGLFVRNAAAMSYQQVLIRQGFEGVPVRRIMNARPVAVAPLLPIADLVQDYFYKFYFKTFPVVEGSRLVGCVSARDVKNVPRDRWAFVTVADVMSKCSAANTVRPDLNALDALKLMNQSGNSRLLVADGDRLLGIVSLKDMMNLLFLKLELEGGEDLPLPPMADLG